MLGSAPSFPSCGLYFASILVYVFLNIFRSIGNPLPFYIPERGRKSVSAIRSLTHVIREIFLNKSSVRVSLLERLVFQYLVLEIHVGLDALDDQLAQGASHLGDG